MTDNRNHRRVSNKDFRTIAVDGSAEKRFGIESKINRMTNTQTHRLVSRNLSRVNAPITKQPASPLLIQTLQSDGVIMDEQDIALDHIEFIIRDKSAEDFKQAGIIFDRKHPSGDFNLSAYDTLYAYQLGLIGRDGMRKNSFRSLMDHLEDNDPYFKSKYITYAELRNKNYIVMDGLRYGSDLVVYEPIPPNVLERMDEIADQTPSKIGIGRSEFGIQSAGLVDLITPDLRMNEIIKGQHLAKKNDLRYFLARVKTSDNLDDSNVSFALLRKDRLRIDFNDKRDMLILEPDRGLPPYEVIGE